MKYRVIKQTTADGTVSFELQGKPSLFRKWKHLDRFDDIEDAQDSVMRRKGNAIVSSKVVLLIDVKAKWG